jgi:4-aminobutyrate aminotransferase/(S)-3-amino-2-methylpropionate transaminase
MMNQTPGAAALSILSFKGGFHGRTFGALSCTHSKPIHKLDIPAFDWPIATYPLYKYPLEQFEAENKATDDRCIAEVEDLIEKFDRLGKPVAGAIVEPIQGEGGDNRASDYFFQQLRLVLTKRQVAFICDEVQTGCGSTGRFWAHEYWGKDAAPDIVTFSKKMLSGGYFYRPEFRPDQAYRIFNTWLGDPSKLVLLNQVIQVIRNEALLDQIQRSGKTLLDGLKSLQSQNENIICNARGRGTFCSIDFRSPDLRNRAISLMHLQGVHCGGSGDQTLRIRTTLTFNERHAHLFIERLERVLKQLQS